MMNNPRNLELPQQSNRKRLLETAMATFLRYGFRKTSMEEIARAASISRQGVYLHFPSKEVLFAAAAQHHLDACFEAATEASDRATTIEEKLACAFDEWVGRHAGVHGSDLADLKETGEHLIGDILRDRENAFQELIATIVGEAGLPAAYDEVGVDAFDLAKTLIATAAGLKHQVHSREEFGQRMGIAIRALCMPLRAPR